MKRTITAAAVLCAALGLAACDAEQTEEGEMPEVQGGNLPEYDVDTADVNADVGTEEVEVPDTVDVPTMDVDVGSADANNAEEAAQ